jgi:hypothetical protein
VTPDGLLLAGSRSGSLERRGHGVYSYVGFGRTDLPMARNVVLALGVIYLVG